MRNIEYRSGAGNRLVVEANGQVRMDRTKVDLRAMGCPEAIVQKIERRNSERASQAQSTDVKARAAAIGKQIEADNQRFAHVLAEPSPAPAAPNVVDAEMQKRLRQASGRISR